MPEAQHEAERRQLMDDARGPDERLGRLPSRELYADAAGEQDADRGRNLGLGA